MVEIDLAAVPNQTFSITLDGHFYNIAIRDTNLCMAASVTMDNVQLISNSRLVAKYPMIPYHYLTSGNFVIVTLTDDLPDWTQFGITQYLIYASADEIAALKAA
jgi:spore germination protein YaaH